MDFQKIDALKNQLDLFLPLPTSILKNLNEDIMLRWIYHSNAIEGNTLTLKETKVVLEGITIGGKTLREHFEVINHREAILFVEDLVQQNTLLNERDIKLLHQLILKNIDQQNAGTYRHQNLIISGATHRPPDHTKVADMMFDFIQWYQTQAVLLHPIERAARVHGEFVKIHPFIDGNRRTSRLLMNLELMKSGFPAAILPVEMRLEYYQALDLAHCTGRYESFIELIAQIVEKSFDPYWWVLGITDQEN